MLILGVPPFYWLPTLSKLFAEYQDALFLSWREIDIDALSLEALVNLAGSLGMDEAAFSLCLQSGSKTAEIEENMSKASGDGVLVLPAVIVNGAKVEGYKPLATYLKLIDDALGH